MTDMVLIHGAFRGGWAWDRVVPFLEADGGHRVFAPDLTAPDATLTSYLQQLVDLFEAENITDALLVGHSQGGFIARAATQPLASRVRHLVYFDAPVPHPGETAFDFRPAGTPPPPVSFGDVIDPRPVTPGPSLSEDDADWINERLVPQPVAPSVEAVELGNPAALALPATYVFFSGTPDGYPCSITRQRLDATGEVYTLIEAPHDGIVSHPEEVATVVVEAARLVR